MRNFSPRTILWLVFVFSIFMLWNSWQMQHIPAVSAPVTQQVVSKDPANTAANAAAPLTADQNVAPKGSSVVLENDVLRLKINTEGGVIEYAELLKHKDAKDKSKNEVLFNTQDGKVYVSRSGLTPETLGLNHKTAFTPSGSDAVMQDGQNDVNLTLSAQSNGVTFKKTYSLKRGSYLVDVNHEVDNTGSAAIETMAGLVCCSTTLFLLGSYRIMKSVRANLKRHLMKAHQTPTAFVKSFRWAVLRQQPKLS
jgi:YidC/Oxa1 family membrane protein insertase